MSNNSTVLKSEELTLEEKRVLLAPVIESIKNKDEYIERMFDEQLYSLFDDDSDGESASMYKLFVTIQPEEYRGAPLMAAASACMMETPCFFMVDM